jgi:hypothetical protein
VQSGNQILGTLLCSDYIPNALPLPLNDLVEDYKYSLGHMLLICFILFVRIVSILALTTGKSVYLILSKGARRV